MFKKMFLLVALIALCLGGVPVFAADTTTETETSSSATLDLGTLVAKLPCLNQAVLYSYDDNQTKYAMSFTVMKLFNYVKIDAMYVPSSEVGGLVSVKLFNVGKFIQFPLLEYVEFEPFVYAGVANIGGGGDLGEADWGAGVKLISIKF